MAVGRVSDHQADGCLAQICQTVPVQALPFLGKARQRLSQPIVLSTIHRLGSTTNLPMSEAFDNPCTN